MEYNWTIPANLTSTAANYRYVVVKVSAATLFNTATTSNTEFLPSTLNGPLFMVSPATTTQESATSTPTPSRNPIPTSTPTPEPVVTEMSNGAKAGIGVGVSLCALCLVTGIFLWLRRRARHQTMRATAAGNQERYDKAELDSGRLEKGRQQQQVLEADSNPLSEMTVQASQRKSPSQEPVELPGTWGRA
ncbi:hypothetical protein PG984_000254 [Apiospora sp. TS-2023a]